MLFLDLGINEEINLLFLFVFVLMACSNRATIKGRWAMEIDNGGETSFKLPDDTIVTPELRFDWDSVYLDIRSDGLITRSDMVGVYSIEDDMITIVSRYGDKRIHRFAIKDDKIIITDKDDVGKILMVFTRIRED